MRHVYECPVRWADLDMLNHVNNVTYVDYLQEARVDMLRTHAPDTRAHDLVGSPTEGLVVVGHDITYLAPIAPRTRPVKIEVWVTDVRTATVSMAYEIYDDAATDGGDRVVYARATTVLAPFVFAEERPRRLSATEKDALGAFLEPAVPAETSRTEPRHVQQGHYPLHVRFSDVDVYGHVNNVKYFEYYQEARIPVVERISRGEQHSVGVVVARKEVDYLRPIRFRAEPYDVHSWISRVGSRSVTVESEIHDGDVVYSRAKVVLVFFDATTQRSAAPPESLLKRLREFAALTA